jgi:hypothetical protein
MAAAGVIGMAMGDQRAILRGRWVDPGVGRGKIDALAAGDDPVGGAGHEGNMGEERRCSIPPFPFVIPA